MKKSTLFSKFFRLVMAVIMVVGMFAATGTTVASAVTFNTWNVSPGESIQAAIDGASAGDTINLAAGVFTEADTVTVTKTLTIQGAGRDVTTVTTPGSGDSTFVVAANGTTITGIKFAGGTWALDLGTTDGHTITNNEFYGNDMAINFGSWQGGADNCLVDNNLFTLNFQGVTIFEGGAHNVITSNTFDGNTDYDVYLGPFNTGSNQVYDNTFIQGGKCFEELSIGGEYEPFTGPNIWNHPTDQTGNSWGDYNYLGVYEIFDMGGEGTPVQRNQDNYPAKYATESKPDLIIYEKHETWVDQQAGTYTISFVVLNIGTADAPVGHDAGIKIDNQIFQEFEIDTVLAPGENVTLTSNVRTISGVIDSISVGADVNQEIDELNEDNNQKLNMWLVPGTELKPDLVVTDLHEEWTDEPNGMYTVFYTVTNMGAADAGIDHYLKVYTDGDPGGTRMITDILKPGDSFSGSFPLHLVGDTDNVSAITDQTGIIDELDENNNTTWNIWPPQEPPAAKPDLIVKSIVPEWIDQEAGTYDVVFTVTNVGSAEASYNFSFLITVDGNQLPSVQNFPPDAVSVGEDIAIRSIAVNMTGDSDNVSVCLDVLDQIDESNETNNCMWMMVNAPEPAGKPDMTVKEMHVEWIDQPNGTYEIWWTATNIGTAEAPGGFQYLLSVDGNPLPAIMPFPQTIAINEDVIFRSLAVNLTGESDNISICLDLSNAVEELNEDNNCKWQMWSDTTPPAKPDLVVIDKHEEWVDEKAGTYEIFFAIQNKGNANAPAGHEVGIKVDNSELQQISVTEVLTPGDIFDGKSMVVTLSGDSDNISVAADVNQNIDESKEDNNKMENVWPVPTIFVPDDYGTIQAAVNAANPGDQIIIRSNEYTESVIVDKKVIIRGDGGMPIIHAPDQMSTVFTLEADGIGIGGLMIDGGFAGIAGAVNNVFVGENYFTNTGSGVMAGNLTVPADNWIITRNIFIQNEFAVDMISSNSAVEENLFSQQSSNDVVFWFQSPGGNFIARNNFVQGGKSADHTDATIQGHMPNFWYDDQMHKGNYWGDYTGVDGNGDGIGDTPYTITGSAGSQDIYPIMEVKPDLVIGDIHSEWVDNEAGTYQVFFTIENWGAAIAPAGHQIGIDIDGSDVQQITITQDMMPGQWLSENTTVFTLAGDTDNITICADATSVVDEEDETNNCAWAMMPPPPPPAINVPGDYSTIQAAVDAAQPGNDIIIAPGTYTENVIVNKSLQIMGFWEEGQVKPVVFVVADDRSNPVFTLGADNIRIVGLDISSSNNTGGAGIYIDGTSYHRLEGNDIHNNFMGIFTTGSEDLVVTHNHIAANTHGIYYWGGTGFFFSGNVFEFNTDMDVYVGPETQVASSQIDHNAFMEGGKCVDDSTTDPQGNAQPSAVSWFDPSSQQGNYWGDYQGTDTNQDGIGETPYDIFNSFNPPTQVAQDTYPIMGMGPAPVEGPDLVVNQMWADWIDPEAQTYRVFYSIQNVGSENVTPGHKTWLKVNDILIDQVPVPVELAPGQEFSANFSLTLTLETDNISICADGNNDIAEADEVNNCGWFMWPPPPPPQVHVPGDYGTIQAAVDAAEPGSDIVVAAGTYNENVIVHKSLQIVGFWEEGQQHPVANVTAADPNLPVFLLTENNTMIKGLNISGATTDGSAAVKLSFTGTSHQRIEDNEIYNCFIGVFAEVFDDLNIMHNRITANAYGIYLWHGTGYYVSSNVFENNIALDVYVGHGGVTGPGQIDHNAFMEGGKCADDTTTDEQGNATPSSILWYDPASHEGNFWGDYQGTDTNQDGIGDAPYDIYNSVASPSMVAQDLYPIMNMGPGPVEGPDLAITEMWANWIDEQAGTYRINFTVENTGSENVTPGHDVGISVNGTPLTPVAVPVELAPGDRFTGNTTSTLAGGTVNITICADVNQEVNESDEMNNCGWFIFPMHGVKVTIQAPEFVGENTDFISRVAIDYVEALNGAQYDIFFNPDVLRLDGFLSGNISGVTIPVPVGETAARELDPGHWRIVQYLGSGSGSVTGAGYLSDIQFHVIGQTTETSPIDIQQGVLSGIEGEIPGEWIGRSVQVGTPVKPGDANGDDDVNILDVTKIIKIILLYDDKTPGADANGDGSVDVLDITKVVRIILRME